MTIEIDEDEKEIDLTILNGVDHVEDEETGEQYSFFDWLSWKIWGGWNR